MARLSGTPKADGYRMPGEFERHACCWMLWPERPDNWRLNARPAQHAYAAVATAIAAFEPVTVGVSHAEIENAKSLLPSDVRIVELPSNDAWMRDMGPSFLCGKDGSIRAVCWGFNAWGGFVDGLYYPWDLDAEVSRKVCDIEKVDYYQPEGFVLEGGSFHVDGQGTVITTEMCLLSKGRNPHLSKEEIEQNLCDFLNAEKVIWLRDGVDPEETNGHIDDVAGFIKPGEVVCIYTEDQKHPFYKASQSAYHQLSNTVDAKGRRLKVHKLCVTKKPVYLKGMETIKQSASCAPRQNGDIAIASYANFLIVNGGVIVPQYGDDNDALALSQIAAMFPDRKVVGVQTEEIAYGGGNIHCITLQQPAEGGKDEL